MTSRALSALQRLILRSARTPLRHLWAWTYRGVARAGGAYLTRGERDASVYLRGGGVGRGDFLPGLSDIDLVVVLGEDPAGPGVAGERVRRRWQRLLDRVPLAGVALDGPRIHEQAELEELAGASALTYGLEPGPPAAGFLGGRATLDGMRVLLRPGLHGGGADWRRMRGPDRRPAEPGRGPAERRIAAWLELVYWWRWVFPACMEPRGSRGADLCLKSVAESARIWLWLAHGERVGDRVEALRAVLRNMPEEEPALRRALELWDELPASPDAPLAALLPATLRITARIAALLEEPVDAEARSVRLAGAGAGGDLLPLVDWRALADPVAAEEAFFLLDGSPGDPVLLGEAARSHPDGAHPAVFGDGLMVLPGRSLERTRMRAVQCPVTDPVSFALAAGEGVAEFPAARGWCAEDVARRAVLEHGAWLQAPAGSWRGSPADGGGRALELLLTAARAGLFLASLGEGEPELCLTATEIARRLPAAVAGDAVAAYRAHVSGGAEPAAGVVTALREIVQALPAYAAPSATIRSTTAGRSAIT